MSTLRYHSHNTKFRFELSSPYLAGEGTLKGLARQHGIYHILLCLWVDKYQRGHFEERESLVGEGRRVRGQDRVPGARDVVPIGPDQLCVADINYIRLRAEFVFLAVILDAWSRRVVGYAVSRHLDMQLTLAALNAEVINRRPGSGLIHHSDRGSQNAAKPYRDCLKKLDIQGSMSRKGDPYDNAQAESFMRTLKPEEVYAYEYETMRDVVDRLPHFIDQIYNRRRLHSASGTRRPRSTKLITSGRADKVRKPACPPDGVRSSSVYNNFAIPYYS